MPKGCPEQIFASWIPNILAVNYLTTIDKITKEQRNAASINLEKGVQHINKIKTNDGYFAMFDGNPNVWFTAYIAKLSAAATGHVALSHVILVKALDWLKGKQNPDDGRFPEEGTNYHATWHENRYNTESIKGSALSAFVAVAFLENKEYKQHYSDVIDKTMKNLNSTLFQLKDNYAVAITAYAFSLYKPGEENAYVEQLKKTAIEHDNQMYWHQHGGSLQSSGRTTVDIEIASYAMMAFLKSTRKADATFIMNWLMKNRNGNGGFYASIDTVIATQALTMMAKEFYHSNPKVSVKLNIDTEPQHVFEINRYNAVASQTKLLNPDSRNVSCNLRGSGNAYVQLSYQYNTKIKEPIRKFDLNVIVRPPTAATDKVLKLKICARYKENDNLGMTLMEINLPSGYVYHADTAEMVKRVGVRVRIFFLSLQIL